MKFLFIYVMMLFSIYACCGGSCILKLNEHLPKTNEPLFLTKHMSYLFPKKQKDVVAIVLRKCEDILIACPGSWNEVIRTRQQVSRPVCMSGTSFMVNYRVLRSQDMACRRRPQTSLKITGRPCASGKGVSIQLGYQVTKFWLPMVEVCHNISVGESYYSQHMLRGSLIPGKETGCQRPGFSRGDTTLYPGYDPNEEYSKKNQESVLTKLVGGRRAQELLNQTSLSRGHLAPAADFLFSTHQALTFFYVNAAPQWQSINRNNWYHVEDSVRKLAEKRGDDFDVVTGTYGVLKVQDSNHSLHETRLHDPSLPVPEYFWKVVRNTRDNTCIALVVTNDPFSEHPRPLSPCSAHCPWYHWPEFENNPKKGIVYCCECKYLKLAVPYLHSEEFAKLNSKKPLYF